MDNLYLELVLKYEHKTENPRVGGSIPSLSTISNPPIEAGFFNGITGIDISRHEWRRLKAKINHCSG